MHKIIPIDDYVKQAYLCAMSGMHSGNKHFTLVTDKEVEGKIAFVFHKVILLAMILAKKQRMEIENRWKAFNLSP